MHKYIIISMISLFIVTTNNAYSQGPNAPEAGAFEPVDATDMVNLLTGDFTYVLPILNVPSPEGGYPLSLSYHAGIAMDQEASWVGLGWSVNPGAINRGVNGYPDDWKNGELREGFFDVGGSETTHSISASYTSLGTGGWTVGGSLSINSNRGFGGSVNLGYGASIPGGGFIGGGATLGIGSGGQFHGSINGGYSSATGGSFGGSIGTNGVGVNGSIGSLSVAASKFNGESSLSASLSGGFDGIQSSIGISFSSAGLSTSTSTKVMGVGIGANSSFNNAVSMNDYNVEQQNESFSVPIPIGEGILSLGYGKQKVSWYLNSSKTTNVSGALYLGDGIKYECAIDIRYHSYYGQGQRSTITKYVDSPSDCSCSAVLDNPLIDLFVCLSASLVSSDPANGGKYFMDVNEIGTNGTRELSNNNAMFPAFDNFNVSAQGLSGSMTPRVSRTGALLGLSRNIVKNTAYDLSYNLSRYSGFQSNYSSSPEIYFYFNNQYSSSLAIDPASFNSKSSNDDIYDYYNSSSGTSVTSRKKDGRFVSYYTIGEMRNGSATRDGLLLPLGFDIDDITNGTSPYDGVYSPITGQSNGVEDIIGSFMITAPDGKTYHYALPVLNLSTTTRAFGAVNNKPERESYFETNQDPYATHWLLTAITGPDYVNVDLNSRTYPDVGDFGYWVRFDYGKWSNTNVWKAPYAEEYHISEDNPNLKTSTYGRKQVYYLDRIKTRTHTALFVKNKRGDNISKVWKRNQFKSNGIIPNPLDFDEIVFTVPAQRSLRLEKIILVKNDDDIINKSFGNDFSTPGMAFTPFDGAPEPDHNLQDNIIDVKDNISEVINKAIKVVDFGSHYTYDLVKNTPNSSSGRLTLNGLSFKGKGGSQLVPPYKFEYNNNPSFDYSQKDLWGFYENDPAAWSLDKIITPTGGNIDIKYESDDYNIATSEIGRVFNKHLKFTFLWDQFPPSGVTTPSKMQIVVEVDDQDSSTADFALSDYFDSTKPFDIDMWLSVTTRRGGPALPHISSIDVSPQKARIVSLDTSNNSMIIEVMATGATMTPGSPYLSIKLASPLSVKTGFNGFTLNQKSPRPYLAYGEDAYSLVHTIVSNKRPPGKTGGGIRVKELSVTDGIQNYKTQYLYNTLNTNEDPASTGYISSGVISYLPFPENSDQPIGYGSELPSPTPMYKYVTVKNGINSGTNQYTDKTVYTFKVMDVKDQNNIKFGDLFEISEQTVLNAYNSGQDKNVNIKKFQLDDNLACLGQILEIQRFNNKGQLLSKTINKYASSSEISQGVIKESFQTYKEIDYKSGIRDEWLINTSTRYIYPSVLKSTTTIQGGYSSTTYFGKHDNVSGQLLETTTIDGRGNEFRTKTIPAYSIPEYSNSTVGYSMGSKVDNPTNKNMLIQTAANLTQIKDNNTWKTIGADITTWNNDWIYPNRNGIANTPSSSAQKIWRKHKTYSWKGDIDTDGGYIGYTGDFDNFNWGINASQTNPKWINTSTINIYDHFSMPLESTDINNNSASTKMGDNDSKIIAVANAKYTSMYYTGAEYFNKVGTITYLNGEIKTSGNAIVDSNAHTGSYIVRANGGAAIEVILPPDPDRIGIKSKFKVAVWVRKGQENNVSLMAQNGDSFPFVTNFNASETITAGDWVLLQGYIDVGKSQAIVTVETTGPTDLDDFRLHPVSSSMTSYVYNSWDELTYILGANNLATKYEYDNAGRLSKTYAELVDAPGVTGGFKLAKEVQYNYKKIAEYDDNGDGVLDISEDPKYELVFTLEIDNPNAERTRVKARIISGSGEYEYRWGTSLTNSFTFLGTGGFGSSNSMSITAECPPVRIYYACQVRDKITGQMVQRIKGHERTNCDDIMPQ